MEEFGRLESSEKTIVILGDKWWPQTAKQGGDRIRKQFLCNVCGRSVMSAQTLEVSPLGVRTLLLLERDTWSMAKWLRKATNEYAPPPNQLTGALTQAGSVDLDPTSPTS